MEQYFNDTIASGFAAQNQLYATLTNLTRSTVQTDAAKEAAKDISRLRTPAYQADLATIEAQFMAGSQRSEERDRSRFTVQQALTKEAAERMFTELTKGQDMENPKVTPEQATELIIDSVAGMDGGQPRSTGQAQSGVDRLYADHLGSGGKTGERR